MPNFSLLFAADLQDAEDAARLWRWEQSDPLHFEFRRPDNMERVRFVQVGRLQNFRWRTKVYLSPNAQRRRDISAIVDLIMDRFFELGDPHLPPPRERRGRREERLKSELRELLASADK